MDTAFTGNVEGNISSHHILTEQNCIIQSNSES